MGGSAAGDGGGLISAAHGSLTQELEKSMKAVYAAEVLRFLMRRTPVTVPALHQVFMCLKPMPRKEVTRIIVSFTAALGI